MRHDAVCALKPHTASSVLIISHIRFKMSCDLADSLLTFEFLVFTKKKQKKKQWPDFCLKSVTYQHSSPISNEVT